jgi:hypothetical protein
MPHDKSLSRILLVQTLLSGVVWCHVRVQCCMRKVGRLPVCVELSLFALLATRSTACDVAAVPALQLLWCGWCA